MKSLLSFCLLFCLSAATILTPLASADTKRFQHTSVERILEFSLLRLKESVENTAQHNERLAFENGMLHDSIGDLQRTREFLSSKKVELLGELPSSTRYQYESRLTKTIDMTSRARRTQELITFFEQDTMRLKEEIQILEVSMNQKQFESHKRMLLKRKEGVQKSLLQTNRRVQSLQKKNKAPIKTIETLQKRQAELVREIGALESQFGKF